MHKDIILAELQALGNANLVKGMSRFGIHTETAYGISMPCLRNKAKSIGKDHNLAIELWKTGLHEACILASMIDNYKEVTANQMDEWVNDFYSWDVCDQCCGNLFRYTPFAYDKATVWIQSNIEFTKRAGFVMMASLAIGDKKAEDEKFLHFFDFIIQHAEDDRNFVRKAVNWALRQIGKRSHFLRNKALECIDTLLKNNNKTAQWIAKDALRELTNEKIIKRIKR
ncbi:MAG: DNA alkylation repair protein [Bacteroidales bacterium]